MKLVNDFVRVANASYKRKERERLKKEVSEMGFDHQKLKQKLKKGLISAVQEYEEYVNYLISLHKSSSESLNWESLMAAPEPKLPLRKSDNQLIAESACRSFKPSLIDKLLGQGKQKHRELMDKAQKARQEDDLIYNFTLKEFKSDLIDWTKIQSVSKGVTSRDPASYEEAIEFFTPFFPVTVLGVLLEYEASDEVIIISLGINAKDIVPDFVPNQLTSGKIKLQDMQDLDFFRLFHSFLCSCALRIARETFALLPVKHVLLNVYEHNVSHPPDAKSTRAILSVKFNEQLFSNVDFDSEDCTALVKLFPHNITFSASGGFGDVDLITT